MTPDEWEPAPRPWVSTRRDHIPTVVGRGGRVCLESVRRAAEAHGRETELFFSKSAVDGEGDLDVVVYIECCFRLGTSSQLLRQSLWHLARRVDPAVFDKHQGEVDGRFRLSLASSPCSEVTMHRALDQYLTDLKVRVEASFERVPMISGSCDAPNVRGLSLSAGMVALPGNDAAWLPPHAREFANAFRSA